MHTIRLAAFPADLANVVDIFREYVTSPNADLAFQDYETEFRLLPGQYAAPMGGIALAESGTRVQACAAWRPVTSTVCELKRVYTRPEARGAGLGRRMVEDVMTRARAAGYVRMCLDVLPEFHAAQHLYASLGFASGESVSHNPVPGTLFLARDL